MHNYRSAKGTGKLASPMAVAEECSISELLSEADLLWYFCFLHCTFVDICFHLVSLKLHIQGKEEGLALLFGGQGWPNFAWMG